MKQSSTTLPFKPLSIAEGETLLILISGWGNGPFQPRQAFPLDDLEGIAARQCLRSLERRGLIARDLRLVGTPYRLADHAHNSPEFYHWQDQRGEQQANWEPDPEWQS